jgi:hypothetical protein
MNVGELVEPPLHGGRRGFESHRLHSEMCKFAGKTWGWVEVAELIRGLVLQPVLQRALQGAGHAGTHQGGSRSLSRLCTGGEPDDRPALHPRTPGGALPDLRVGGRGEESVQPPVGLLRQEVAGADRAAPCVVRPRPPHLQEIVPTAISAVTAQDARGFFEHSGYRLQIQSL